MKLIIFQIITLLLILSSKSFAQTSYSINSYSFPHIDGLTSTISTASVGVPADANWLYLKLLPLDRYVGGEKVYVKSRLYSPKTYCSNIEKSIVFVLPGIGSKASTPLANFYANELAKKCQYSLIVPSIFHKQFIKGVSKSGFIGEARKDMKDLYEFLKYTKNYLQINNNLYFNNYSLMGYSLGALSSAFLAKIDSKERIFNFKKVLLINTPVDLQYAMDTIDSYASNNKRWRKFRKIKERARLGKNIVSFRRYIPSNISVNNFKNRISHLSQFEKKALIGKSIAEVIPDLIEHGHETMSSIFNYSMRLNSSKSYTFKSYFSNVFIPFKKFIAPNSIVDVNLHNEQNSLSSLQDFLSSSNNIYLMHNVDDFLLKAGDVDYLKGIFRGRMYIYPRGGHMGNAWVKQNLNDMMYALKI